MFICKYSTKSFTYFPLLLSPSLQLGHVQATLLNLVLVGCWPFDIELAFEVDGASIFTLTSEAGMAVAVAGIVAEPKIAPLAVTIWAVWAAG